MNLPASASSTISRISLPVYILSMLCIIVPPLDQVIIITGMGPINPNAEWRWRLIGAVSGAALVPLIGLTIGLVTSMLAGNRLMHRVFMVLAIVGALGLLLAFAMFVLDTLQVRGTVSDTLIRSFDVIVLKNALTQLIQITVFILLVLRARSAMQSKPREREQTGLIRS